MSRCPPSRYPIALWSNCFESRTFPSAMLHSWQSRPRRHFPHDFLPGQQPWLWSTTRTPPSGGGAEQMAHTPSCISSIAAYCLDVIPYDTRSLRSLAVSA